MATEDEMVGWHHQLNGHKFEQTPGDSEGQGSLVCCHPWGHKELDMTVAEQQQYLGNSFTERSLHFFFFLASLHGKGDPSSMSSQSRDPT